MSEVIDFNELKAAGALPSPNGVLLAVLRLCQRENTPLPELAQAIQADPVLAGRIIKLGNSANLNRRRPIASVTTDVLILVGVQAVRQVVLGLSLINANRSGSCPGFDYTRFWSRSVAMGCTAQALGIRVRVAPMTELFTCGLLSGIGRLALASARPQAYARLLDEMAGKPTEALTHAESALFGFSHLSLTTAMMTDWSIPRLFSDAVLFHENPKAAPYAEDSRQQLLVHVLHMAALVADACVGSDAERATLSTPIRVSGELLGLDAEQIVSLQEEVDQEWIEWTQVLQLSTARH